MKSVNTYIADIYIGSRIGYDGTLIGYDLVKATCEDYVKKGLCVTVAPLEFIYTGGDEPGYRIGMIAYPRFPKEEDLIREDAMELAFILMDVLQQFRCTVVCTDKTYLLENPNLKE